MNNIFIVYKGWHYEGYYGDCENVDERKIERIVDSEGKAISYIQDQIRVILENYQETCKRLRGPFEDMLIVNDVPTFEYIKEHNYSEDYGIVYEKDSWNNTWFYSYSEYEVF